MNTPAAPRRSLPSLGFLSIAALLGADALPAILALPSPAVPTMPKGSTPEEREAAAEASRKAFAAYLLRPSRLATEEARRDAAEAAALVTKTKRASADAGYALDPRAVEYRDRADYEKARDKAGALVCLPTYAGWQGDHLPNGGMFGPAVRERRARRSVPAIAAALDTIGAL